MKTDIIGRAARNIKFDHVDPIKATVDWKALNALNVASAIFKNTEIAELANYPKKPKIHF